MRSSVIDLNTAIILFSLTPKAQVKQKKYASHSQKGNLQIAKVLESKSLKESHATGIPVFRFSEKNQKGSSFGEKLTNSISEVYAKGFKKVIIIGNDCPYLNADELKKTITNLQSSSLVLGNTGNDGVYVIGLDKAVFSKELFTHLPWQKKGLIQALKKYSQNVNAEIHWRKQLTDLNSTADMFSFLCNERFSSVAVLIKNILASLMRDEEECLIIGYSDKLIFSCSSLRAPPVAA